MSPANNPNVAVVDASILVSITSNEAATHQAAENAFRSYSQNGWIFNAPHLIVAEVLYALCQKLAAGILTELEYEVAIESFRDYLSIISFPNNESDLMMRAVQIRENYGCSRSSDGLYIALAEELSTSGTTELFTLDGGMVNQAAKNAPTVTIRKL